MAIKSKRKCRPKASRRQPEGNLQDAIRQLIALKYRWRHKRNNVHGPARVLGGGIAKCGERGEADITVYVPAHPGSLLFNIVHLEVKNPGEYQNPDQKLWQKLVEDCGEYYRVVRSQEDVENYFKEMGWAK